jgi:hypothetical protein
LWEAGCALATLARYVPMEKLPAPDVSIFNLGAGVNAVTALAFSASLRSTKRPLRPLCGIDPKDLPLSSNR